MKEAPNLTPTELEESARKLRARSFLEVLRYDSLINELVQLLINNKEPYVLKNYEEMKEYPEIVHYSYITPSLSVVDEQSQFYFHLEGVEIEIEPNSKYTKETAEDNMHKNIVLTVVYC